MDIKLTSKEGLNQAFKVIVSASDILEKKKAFIKSRASRVKVDGFRPGKAPFHVIEQRLGEDALNHVLRTSIDTAVKTTVKENNLRYIGEPNVEFDEFSEGKDLSFSMAFELMPEVEVKDFTGLTLEKLTVDVGDKEIDKALADLHKEHKSFKPSEAALKKGDRAEITMTLSLDGKKLSGYTGVDVTVELGDKTFMLSGMEEGLLGLKAGEDKSFDSEVSKNFQDAVISGKKVQVHALVKKTLSPVQHKLDDAFAKEFGYDSFDALKEVMKTNVTRNYESVARLYLKRHMLDALEGMYSFDLPKSMVENEFKTIWTHLQSEIEDAKSKGEFDESDSKPEEELRTEYMGIAERRVKLGLVISEISRAEKIQLSQDELRNALYREATKYPGQERQVMDHFKNHPHSIERIAAPILEDKVVDHIATKAKITETQVNVQDLKKKVKGVVPSFFDNEEETA